MFQLFRESNKTCLCHLRGLRRDKWEHKRERGMRTQRAIGTQASQVHGLHYHHSEFPAPKALHQPELLQDSSFRGKWRWIRLISGIYLLIKHLLSCAVHSAPSPSLSLSTLSPWDLVFWKSSLWGLLKSLFIKESINHAHRQCLWWEGSGVRHFKRICNKFSE